MVEYSLTGAMFIISFLATITVFIYKGFKNNQKTK